MVDEGDDNSDGSSGELVPLGEESKRGSDKPEWYFADKAFKDV